MPPLRVLVLLGPGLDGQLCLEMLRRSGADVTAATLSTPFTNYFDRVVDSATRLQVPLMVLKADNAYLQRVRHPRFGYTREMAPCLDCKVAILRAARERMEECGAQLLCTGDVVGQRTPGQTKRDFALVDFHAGVEGRVLRPLSAQLLPPVTLHALVPAEVLLDISGRGRQRQLSLAREWGWQDIPAVTSGCLLADAAYRRKFTAALELGIDDEATLPLLQLGRCFRLESCLLVIGRNAADNAALQAWQQSHGMAATLLTPVNFVGPSAVIRGAATPAHFEVAAQLMMHYGRPLTGDNDYLVAVRDQGQPTELRLRPSTVRPAIEPL